MSKISIVLDTNIINKFFSPEKKWEDTEIGKFLLEERDYLEVFATPDNIIEIASCMEIEKRNTMANALASLTECSRITASWEIIFAQDLFSFMNKHWPGSIKESCNEYVDRLSLQSSLIFSGLLARLSLFKDYRIPEYDKLMRPKYENAYIQSSLLKNIDIKFKELQEQIKNNKTDYLFEDDLNLIKDLSLGQIWDKVEENIKLFNPNAKKYATKLESNKESLINLYTISFSLKALFNLFFAVHDIYFLIDYKKIVSQWSLEFPENNLENGIPIEPLNELLVNYFTERSNDHSLNPLDMCSFVLEAILKRYTKIGLIPITKVMMNIYFSEIIEVIRDSAKPQSKGKKHKKGKNDKKDEISKGLILDINLGTCLLYSNIFFTGDVRLSKSLLNSSERIERIKNFEVVTDLDQLKRLIKKYKNKRS